MELGMLQGHDGHQLRLLVLVEQASPCGRRPEVRPEEGEPERDTGIGCDHRHQFSWEDESMEGPDALIVAKGEVSERGGIQALAVTPCRLRSHLRNRSICSFSRNRGRPAGRFRAPKRGLGRGDRIAVAATMPSCTQPWMSILTRIRGWVRDSNQALSLHILCFSLAISCTLSFCTLSCFFVAQL